MSIAHETGRVRSGELAIFYRKLGRPGGVPILIVHGLSYFSYDWLEAARALGAAREVVAIDMRGFGDSDCSPAKDYSVPAMAQDIVSVLDHLGWPRAVLAGHSMGGRSSTYVAARHPGRAAGLVLVDYTPENAPAGAKRVTQTVARAPDFFSSVDEAMRYFASEDRPRFEAYLRRTGDGYALKRDPHFRDQFRKALDTGERPKPGVDMWSLIGEVRCPILSLRGTRSDMYAAETVQKMRAANPRLQVAQIDAGHNIAGENLDAFVSELRPFLDELEESHEHERR